MHFQLADILLVTYKPGNAGNLVLGLEKLARTGIMVLEYACQHRNDQLARRVDVT